MPGSYVQFDVENIDEAVALAERFKAAGSYRYFRGQRDSTWSVQSSFARLDEARRQEEIRKFEQFYQWVKESVELLPYLQDDDGIIATAQHHGIAATTFIDFSSEPEVAGWFATDGAVVGDHGAIFMINPDEVSAIFEAMTKRGIALRFLHPDVANLWRLQAQHGLFLEAHTDVERIWPLDRIVFPQTGRPPKIERRRIYPDRQSQLEQMIDQHLTLKKRQEAFRSLIETGNIAFVEIGEAPDLLPPDLETPGLPEDFARTPDERWAAMDLDSPPPRLAVEEAQACPALEHLIQTRRASTDLILIDPDLPRRNGTLQAKIDRLWSGMRPHPYDAGQVASAIRSLVRFDRIFGDFPLDAGTSPEEAAPQLLEDPFEIEMGIAGGGATRACISAARLWSALTPAARELLGFPAMPTGGKLMGALGRYYGKTLPLYEPTALIDLFADEIVPWQVVTRRNPVVYWPKHITSLGLP